MMLLLILLALIWGAPLASMVFAATAAGISPRARGYLRRHLLPD